MRARSGAASLPHAFTDPGRPMLSMHPPGGDFVEVAAALGSPMISVGPVGWGDARATFRLVLADGRTFAVRRMPGPDVTPARRLASAMTAFADAGLPTVRPTLTSTGQTTWLSVPWVDGPTGAAWLDDPARARRIADRMGQLLRRIGGIDPAGLRSVAPLVSDEDQAHAIDVWLANVTLEPGVRHAVGAAVSGRGPADRRPSTVVHGDFAPINVIVDAEGEIRALVDFEHVRLGRSHTDVAWWGWVVRHHHPEAWAAAWPTFRGAAGVDPSVSLADLHALALVGLVERAATATATETQRRWLERLIEATEWPVSIDDQVT